MKVISGGQDGVDQAALRAALECGLAIGGWCPPGRTCESGRIPEDYPLQETPVERSQRAPDVSRSLRTEWNVRDADATLVLVRQQEDPGTAWTLACARLFGRPVIKVNPCEEAAGETIRGWLGTASPAVLNVAGPSEGTEPGIGEQTFRLLMSVFQSRRHELLL